MTVDGIAHFLSATAGEHLRELCAAFEPAWCTGWEEKANEYLPHALGLPGPLPASELRATPTAAGAGTGSSPRSTATRARPAGGLDRRRPRRALPSRGRRRGRRPTLLVGTDPAVGLTDEQVSELLEWAERQAAVR